MLLVTISSSVFADTYPGQTYYISGNFSAPTVAELCDLRAGNVYLAVPGKQGATGISCDLTYKSDGSWGGYYSVTPSLNCPYGGWLSGSTCKDVPSCPTDYIRSSTTGQCIKPCQPGEYNDSSGACQTIPNCNLTAPSVFGSYFDVNQGTCLAAPTHICMSTVNNLYCPPIDDCISSEYVCSNSPSAVAQAQSTRDADLAKAKADAQDAADNADLAAKVAAEQAAQRAAEAQAAANAERDARVAAIDNSLTPEQRAQAEMDFAQQAAREQAAQTKADNAAAAATAAKAAAQAAHDALAQAKAQTRPGDAAAAASSARKSQNDAARAVNDSYSGGGNGGGPGTGSQDGLPTATDNIVSSVNGVRDAILNRKTDCQIDPTHVGCASLGDVPDKDPVESKDASGLGSGTFTYSSWGSGGSCPDDRLLADVAGVSIYFPFEYLCRYLTTLAPIVIALSLLGAGKIVLGSVLE